MNAAAAGLTAGAAAALAAIAAAGWIVALAARRQARRDRAALALAQARERDFVAAARRLADAARDSIEAVREEIERAVRTIVPAIDVVLFFEEIDARLTCVFAWGDRAAYFRGTAVALDDGGSLLVRALSAGHRAIADSQLRALQPTDAFALAIPLVLDAGRRCVLYVASPLAHPSEVADRIVQLVDGAAPAYRIAVERTDDRMRAEYDGLTGLLTARAFRTALAARLESARTQRLGRIGLLFVDTDRFKAWNDTYGHASGDALLRELARLLRAAAVDAADLVARNGGDEFCLVFADAEKSQTIERAERLRASIAAADFAPLRPAGIDAEPVTISASIGVACFPTDAQSASELLEQADAAMYHSKRTGRNAVAYYDTDGQVVRAH